MKAHQIIYTSCRRGISGSSSGFQVWSCDEELFKSGKVDSPRYQSYFPFETPKKPSISAFGFRNVPDVGDVYCLNTRLKHDYAGEGTRAGNLLNHSICIEEQESSFYPAEVYGVSLFRTEMQDSEVNTPESPPFLPQLDVFGAGVITLEKISEWVLDGDRLEVLKMMFASLFEVCSNGKKLVVVDDESNVIRWIAALCYFLPLSLAKQISFLTYSDQADKGPAVIVGTGKEALSNIPSYSINSLIVFDILSNNVPKYEVGGAYIEFIESIELVPENIEKFTQFAENNFDLGFSLVDFDNAFSLYMLLNLEVADWSESAVHSGLQYAAESENAFLRRSLIETILNRRTEIQSVNAEEYYDILEFLINCWQDLTSDEREYVKDVAVQNLLAILQNSRCDDASFIEDFKRITASCADVGLNIFDIIGNEENSTRLFCNPSIVINDQILNALALALTEYLLKNNIEVQLIAFDEFYGRLYKKIICSVTADRSVSALGIAQRIVASSAGSCSFALNVAFTLGQALEQQNASSEIALGVTLDAFWDTTLDCLAACKLADRFWIVNRLIDLSTVDPSRYALVSAFFNKSVSQGANDQEAFSMFGKVVEGLGASTNQQSDNCFAEVGAHYVASLSAVSDENVTSIAREALRVSLKSQVYAPFLADLASLASQEMSFSRLCESDLQLVRCLEENLNITQRSSFSGNVALLALATRFKEAAKSGKVGDIYSVFMGLEGRLNLCGLENGEVKDYAKSISKYAVRVIQTLCGYEDFFNAFNATPESDLILFEELYDKAVKLYIKHDSIDSLLALNALAVLTNSSSYNKICSKHLGSLKAEKILDQIDPKTQNVINRELGRDSANRRCWKGIVDSSVKRSTKPLLSHFRK